MLTILAPDSDDTEDCGECGDCPTCSAVCEDAEGFSRDSSEPDFADPGGRSALRAARPGNPRNLPCPTCGEPDRLTPADRRCGYQCDDCADRAEGYGD